MGTDSAHRRLSVPPGPIGHPGTSFIYSFMTLRNVFLTLSACLRSTGAVIYFIQRLKVDLDRSTAVNQFLGARVARCSLTGLANFLYR